MAHIGALALLVLVAIFAASTAAVGFTALSIDQTLQLGMVASVLFVFTFGAFLRRHWASEALGGLVLWVCIGGVAMIGYTLRDDILSLNNRVASQLRPGIAMIDETTGAASFRARRDGHFVVDAYIGSIPVPMLFDTGASAVVLSDADAIAVGLDPQQLNYDIIVSTANGTGRAATVLLPEMRIGSIVRKDVKAFISEPGALDSSLLGMTFLETLDSFTVRNGVLELMD